MISYSSGYTEKELKKLIADYDENLVKSAVKNHPDLVDYFTSPEQAKTLTDRWSVYKYGNTLKIVYVKALRNPKHPKKPPKKPPAAFYGCNPYKPSLKLKTLKQALRDCDRAKKAEQALKNARLDNNISRTRARIFELAACNEFQYFCTFTQDQTKRDRFDLSEFRKDFAQLVRNINRGRADGDKIKYLLIPEKHKKGGWHMHGLLKGLTDKDLRAFELSENIPKRLKDLIRSGTPVYDWTRYRRAFGYFTCTEIENGEAVSRYITKYISKDLQSGVIEAGHHLFFASQGLKSRDVITSLSAEPCPITEWDYENDYIKCKEIKLDE